MLIIFLIIGIGLLISGILAGYLANKRNRDESTYAYIGVGGGVVVIVVSFLVLLGGIFNISTSRTIDNKIAMYEEENIKIEASVTQAVEKYLEHELNIFDDLQGTDIQTLLVVYPEINGNELVKKQIEIYVSNNDKVRQLKEDKLNIEVWRFWVYFG